MNEIDFLEKFDETEKVEFIPQGVFSPLRKKITNFLNGFTVEEIQKLKCTTVSERNYLSQRVRAYARDCLPKVFFITSRKDEEGKDCIFIKRKEDIKKDGIEKLHNKHKH